MTAGAGCYVPGRTFQKAAHGTVPCKRHTTMAPRMVDEGYWGSLHPLDYDRGRQEKHQQDQPVWNPAALPCGRSAFWRASHSVRVELLDNMLCQGSVASQIGQLRGGCGLPG